MSVIEIIRYTLIIPLSPRSKEKPGLGMSTLEADDLSTREDDTRPLDISSDEPSEGASLAKDLVRRCQKLLSELESFQKYLEGCSQEHAVEVKPFQNAVLAESRSLDKVD